MSTHGLACNAWRAVVTKWVAGEACEAQVCKRCKHRSESKPHHGGVHVGLASGVLLHETLSLQQHSAAKSELARTSLLFPPWPGVRKACLVQSSQTSRPSPGKCSTPNACTAATFNSQLLRSVSNAWRAMQGPWASNSPFDEILTRGAFTSFSARTTTFTWREAELRVDLAPVRFRVGREQSIVLFGLGWITSKKLRGGRISGTKVSVTLSRGLC